MEATEASAAIDWKPWVAIAGVLVSLIWNLINTRRNNRLDRLTNRNSMAIRFEAVYGSAVSEAIKELSGCAELVVSARLKCASIDQANQELSEFKSRLGKITYSFVMDLGPIGDSKLSRCPDKWKSLGLYDWDPVFKAYERVRQASNMSECAAALLDLETAIGKPRQSVVMLRDTENDLAD